MKAVSLVTLVVAVAGCTATPGARIDPAKQVSTMLQLRYTGFFVPDVPATVAFYQAAFGLPLRYMHPSRGYAELETGATLVAFVSEHFQVEAALLGGRTLRVNRRELDPVAAQLAFVARDLDADWQRAVAAGAEVVKLPEPKPWGQTVGYLRDRDGIIVELATQSPRDR